MSTDVSQKPCPRCQFLPAPGDVFCRECGQSLNNDAALRETISLGHLPLPVDLAPRPSASEFFAGPETAANPIDWSVSAPIQPPFVGLYPPADTPTAPLAAIKLKRRRRRKTALLVLAVALVILGAGSSVGYLLTRTNPVIQVTSDYTIGATLIGTPSTSFHISGQHFFANTDITFLLDGQPTPGDKAVQSDAHGAIQDDLAVTAQWAVGKHLLTARDALGNTAGSGVSVQIVTPGQDGTPGPNGAPPDDGSFSIDIQGTAMTASGQSFNFAGTLSILNTGSGGSTCGVEYTGRPLVYTGTLQNSKVTYTETIILACQVTYKQGHLHYVDTATSDTFVLGDGRHCAAPGPYTSGAFDGAFSSSTSVSGAFYRDYSEAICTDKTYVYHDSETGTWSGAL